jgi:hypothetical protein
MQGGKGGAAVRSGWRWSRWKWHDWAIEGKEVFVEKQEQSGERGEEVQVEETTRMRYAAYHVQPWVGHSWGGWREFCGFDITG